MQALNSKAGVLQLYHKQAVASKGQVQNEIDNSCYYHEKLLIELFWFAE